MRYSVPGRVAFDIFNKRAIKYDRYELIPKACVMALSVTVNSLEQDTVSRSSIAYLSPRTNNILI